VVEKEDIETKGRNEDVTRDLEDLQLRRDWLASRLAVSETLRDIVTTAGELQS
jgi:hypothetical protein